MKSFKLFLLSLLFLCSNAFAQVFIEVGNSKFADHGPGVWYQADAPHSLDLTSVSFGIGYKIDNWTVGLRHLGKTNSTALATSLDQDYVNNRCIRNCDIRATFNTSGSVFGIFGEYIKPIQDFGIGAGLYIFQPKFSVELLNWRQERCDPPINGFYVNDFEIKVSPYLIGSYTYKNLSIIGTFYTSVKSAGDNGFESRASLYSGKVYNIGLRYTF